MGNPWFQFKKFRVSQEKSALKVGTDGVLLGAWCNVNGARRILDVGTGTGVIALMLAQRSENCIEPKTGEGAIRIEAVEISAEAYSDASVNFGNSPWKERFTLHCADFTRFQPSGVTPFDLIVSNPPFFKNSLRSTDHSSSVARHDVTLSFDQLVVCAKKLLAPQGRLAVIIPAEAFDDFRETARLAGFYLSRKTLVIPKTGKPPKRVLLEFSVVPCYPVADELVILLSEHQYSDDFISLTKDFYLNFG